MILKVFITTHFGGKTYADGGIALVKFSEEDPKKKEIKEIMVVGPWSGPGESGYIVENWSEDYCGYFNGGRELELPDSIWDAVLRLKDYDKTDSVKERQEIVQSFEKIIGAELKIAMRLAGALG